jgi:multidrug resistance efflux pump
MACSGGEVDASGQNGAAVPLVVSRGDLVTEVLLTGELVAEDAAFLVTPNANVWPMEIRWLAEDGIEVRTGDSVVEFDTAQLTSNIEELRLTAIEAENRIISTRARVAADIAEATYLVKKAETYVEKTRMDAEVPSRLFSKRDYQSRLLDLERAELQMADAQRALDSIRKSGEADIKLDEIELRRAREAVAQAEQGIELLTLHAPCDGVLVVEEQPYDDRHFQAGDNAWPGLTIASIPALSSMIISARMFDVDDGRIEAGQKVEAILDAFPDRVFTGRVRKLEGFAESHGPLSRRRSFRTTIELDRVDTERMRPGMSVKVVVRDEPLQGVLLAPRIAIGWHDREPVLRLANGDWKPVTLGPCNPSHCVIEQGAEPGWRLAPAAEASS